MELYKFNNLDGGLSWGKKHKEIYDVLDTMRNKTKKDKFDYKCDPSGSDPSGNYLNLPCEEAKMLKYILQFNLKRKNPLIFMKKSKINLSLLINEINPYIYIYIIKL